MNSAAPHSSFVKIERRPITAEERRWIHDIVSSGPAWSEVQLGDLFAVAACTCGCRSVVLEEPEHTQNNQFIGRQDLVGEIDIKVLLNGKEDFVSVLLHYAEGNLTLLEVIWYNFPEPIPGVWVEVSRDLRISAFTALALAPTAERVP